METKSNLVSEFAKKMGGKWRSGEIFETNDKRKKNQPRSAKRKRRRDYVSMGKIRRKKEKMKKESRKQSYLLDKLQSKGLVGKEGEKNLTWRKESLNQERERVKNERKNQVEFKVSWKRQDGSRVKEIQPTSRKELEFKVERGENQGREGKKRVRKRIQTRGKVVRKKRSERRQAPETKGNSGPREWKEQVVRVGTGYRVRKDEKDPRTRRFDVGYCDRKPYKRKDGREATVDQSSMGRTLVGKGENARVKVINAVAGMEKRRAASEYTGSGIRRKSRVGKRKLKPTKAQAKQ
jgi:hypothetical protein